MSSVRIAVMPTTLPCEVCGKEIRVMPFAGLHILCPDCSKLLHERTKEHVNQMILQMKKELE